MANRNFTLGIEQARTLDQQDVLSKFKDRFYPLSGNKIYMDGNSLGLASKDAEQALLKVMEVWKNEGILIWNADNGHYFNYGKNLGERVGKLLNAEANEVMITANTTLNIHQAIATFWKPTKERYKILVDDLNFPTDRYAIDSQIALKGMCIDEVIKIVPSQDGVFIDEQAVIEAMTEEVAVILLPSVLYRSSQLLDMERLTKEAHKRGIYIGFDLCHSIGAVAHDFKTVQPDFSIWCNYKYLSAGPGSTAGIYINQKHFDKKVGLAGWFGNKDETQFQLKHQFDQAVDITAYQTGTPNIFSMAPLEGVMNIYEEAGMANVRAKSLNLTAYMMYLIEERLGAYGYSYNNETEDSKRGGHVALVHDEAYRICLALKQHNIIPDYREPNVIRLAPIALYNSYEEVYKLIDTLELIGKNKEWNNFSNERAIVI
ncbi:kynureninase [Myroides marinus]|uniref:kynureninase n=1 Tax=Myroides marinus TaxID=703342 RepID=UPI0025760FB8|nr:kynureninase [Myroides marinus]MDM1346694.1 kynureninase [Myroides marinus]MDM1362138.1 kynureninase [Myroides marinus]MDM1364229.1 kynureninase [Myroides marinus]MDM1369359.1 kynureninase [Myroides marinus]MDM1374302.1 kynureninase [Myroides marinus]